MKMTIFLLSFLCIFGCSRNEGVAVTEQEEPKNGVPEIESTVSNDKEFNESYEIVKLYQLNLRSPRSWDYTLFFLGIQNGEETELIEITDDYTREEYLPGSYRQEIPLDMKIGTTIELGTWRAGGGEKYYVERSTDGLDIYRAFLEELNPSQIETIERETGKAFVYPGGIREKIKTVPIDKDTDVLLTKPDFSNDYLINNETEGKSAGINLELIEIKALNIPSGEAYSIFILKVPLNGEGKHDLVYIGKSMNGRPDFRTGVLTTGGYIDILSKRISRTADKVEVSYKSDNGNTYYNYYDLNVNDDAEIYLSYTNIE